VKRIWVLQTGEPLPIDPGAPRPMRAMNLAAMLEARGHDVTIWSSAFYHQAKRQRALEFSEIRVSELVTVNLIPSPGYSRNIGLGRLYDHFSLARNLRALLNSGRFAPPDCAFVGFPPIESAHVMTHWLAKHGVPTIVDAKDQWPTIFVEAVPRFVRPVARVVLHPYFALSRSTFRSATGFCSMSDEFIDWMCVVAGRERNALDRPAPLTAPELRFDDDELAAARTWWRQQGVDVTSHSRVSFVGSLSAAFDFSYVATLARRCLAAGVECQFVICGSGGEQSNVSRILGGIPNVVLPGWIDGPKIQTLYDATAALIAPYRPNDAFNRSVPNKIVDALSSGVGVLSTIGGITAEMVKEFGIGCCSPDPDELFAELRRLLGDRAYSAAVKAAARKLYLDRFGYEKVYGELSDWLVDIARRK
jgi:glycosyltransferase involved in cell wall biosynthesis